MNLEQYQILCARRQAFDGFVWQTPPLAMAAQAFLLAAAFDPDANQRNSIVLAIFSGIVGLASIQLMMKHRHFETMDAELLAGHEAETDGFAVLHGKRPNAPAGSHFLVRLSSYRVWVAVLTGFCLLAVYAIIDAALS